MLAFIESLDHQIFFLLNHGLSSPWLDFFMWTVSLLGDGAPLILAVGIIVWVVDRQTFKQHYPWLVVGVIVGCLVVQGFKFGLQRHRPLKEFATSVEAGTIHINVIGNPLRYRSFPSGHTQAAASVFTYLLYLYPRYWYYWGSGPLLVGLSRIYLGAHFPFDVLAGALLGGLSATGAWRMRLRRVELGMEQPEHWS